MFTVWRPRGSNDVQHELFVPSLLSTELSHRPVSDHRVFQHTILVSLTTVVMLNVKFTNSF